MNENNLPKLEPSLIEIVRAKTILMLQIEQQVKNTFLNNGEKFPNDAKVGMYVKIIFDHLEGKKK